MFAILFVFSKFDVAKIMYFLLTPKFILLFYSLTPKFILPFYSLTLKFILLFCSPTPKFKYDCVINVLKIRGFCLVVIFGHTNCNFLVGMSRVVILVFCNFALLLCFFLKNYEK